jgi:hypothetical protein
MNTITNEEFIKTVFGNVPQDAVPWVTGFEEDPLQVTGKQWGGAPVTNGALPWMIEDHNNNFFSISSFRAGPDGRYHRRKEHFAACHLIMIDDVGTKVQAHEIALEPSYELETSPGNYQYAYIVGPPETDGELVARVQDALVAQGLAVDGKDPGMKGVTRYGRLPVGRNTKAKYAEQLGGLPFVQQLEEWHPERRFTLQEIIEAFDLDLDKTKTAYSVEEEDLILKALEYRGLLKGPISGKEGVWDVTCPWLAEHTDRGDSGAAYFQAHYEGREKPGFKCHHGHCESRTIRDLIRALKPERAAEGGIDVAKAEFETLKQDAKVISNVVDIKPFLDRMAGVKLSRSERDALLRDLKDAAGIPLGVLRGDMVAALKDAGVLKEDDETVPEIVIRLALEDGIELWHDSDKEWYATLRIDDHVEHHRLKTKAVRSYLQRLYYRYTDGSAVNSEAMTTAINALGARAEHDGEQHTPYIRVAEVDGVIYLDLCNEKWEVVRITTKDWVVIQAADCPVRFRRGRGMLPLPHPVKAEASEINKLAVIIGLDAEGREWKLVVGFLLGALRGNIPFAILVCNGEQGSGKSMAGRLIRGLVDPNKSPLRRPPKEDRDLLISCVNSWVQGFDNLSHIPDWLSDGLCRLATGGGLGTRELYTDDEEIILDAKRPVILNGITDFVTRPDLIDRSILVEFPVISEDKRKSEAAILEEFEKAQPSVLGALLTVISKGLTALPKTKLDELPRMADFALWVTACEEALGWKSKSFIDLFKEARETMLDSSLEGESIYPPLRKLAEAGEWKGTSTALLHRLAELEGLELAKRMPDGWPKGANSLSRKLKRLAPAMRTKGLNAKQSRAGEEGARQWHICSAKRTENKGGKPSEPSEPSESSPDKAFRTDDMPDDIVMPGPKPSVKPSVVRAAPCKASDDTDDTDDISPLSRPPRDTYIPLEEGDA